MASGESFEGYFLRSIGGFELMSIEFAWSFANVLHAGITRVDLNAGWCGCGEWAMRGGAMGGIYDKVLYTTRASFLFLV